MNGRLIGVIIAGTVVGAAVGLLAAPRPGKESRRILRVKADDCATALRERFKKGRQEENRVPLGS